MANKRMYSKNLIESDKFLVLTEKAQLLYFFTGLQADDDGIVDNMNFILRMTQLPQSALQELVDNAFLHVFDSGNYVILHWYQNNNLRNDRYTKSVHVDERNVLALKESKEYKIISKEDKIFGYNSHGIPLVYPVKNSTEKSKSEENSSPEEHKTPSTHSNTNTAKDLILYLNGKTGQHFSVNSDNSLALLNALLSRYTATEIKLVIDCKVSEWLNNEKMSTYLRPSTLFGSKFDEYLVLAKSSHTPIKDLPAKIFNTAYRKEPYSSLSEEERAICSEELFSTMLNDKIEHLLKNREYYIQQMHESNTHETVIEAFE